MSGPTIAAAASVVISAVAGRGPTMSEVLLSLGVGLAGWVIASVAMFLFYYNAAPSRLAEDADKATASVKQRTLERERELQDAVADRNKELATVSARLAGIENSRPQLVLTATWRTGYVPPWRKGSIADVPANVAIAAKCERPIFLVVTVDNRPVVPTPQSVAEHVSAAVSFFDGTRCTHAVGGAWFETRAARYDPDGWLPFLSDDPVTIEPGRTRQIAVFRQYDHEADPQNACLYALEETSCQHDRWAKPALQIHTDPVRIVVRVHDRWECVELELTATAAPAGHYTFTEQLVRSCP